MITSGDVRRVLAALATDPSLGEDLSPVTPLRSLPAGSATTRRKIVMQAHDMMPWSPSCSGCGGPLDLRGDNNYVYCRNEKCACEAVPAGDVVGECGQSGRGLPRPVIGGRPVPWLAPIIAGRVAWTGLNVVRLRAAQQCWLCQVCGDSLDTAPTAWVAVSDGDVAAGGAMHSECMALARTACPVLRDDRSFVFTEVRRDDLVDGWAGVIERLVRYEEKYGRLPDLIPLEQIS